MMRGIAKLHVFIPNEAFLVTFFHKLLCFILKDSAFALSQSEPDKSARGQSHLGDGGETAIHRSLPDPSLPSTAARRLQVMGRACGAYPSRTSLRRASSLKLTALCQPPAPSPRCCLPPQRRKKRNNVQLPLPGTSAPPSPSPAFTSRPTLNLVGAVFVHVDPCL